MVGFLIPETYLPQPNAQLLGLRCPFWDAGPGRGNLLNFQCSDGTVSGETPNPLTSSDVLLLASVWLGFSLSHIFVLPKQLLTGKGRRQRLPFMFWILCVSKACSQPGLRELWIVEQHRMSVAPSMEDLSSILLLSVSSNPCKQSLEAKQHPPVRWDRESCSNSSSRAIMVSL